MLRSSLVLLGLALPAMVQAQTPAPVPVQQRVSLWASHAIQNSIQAAQLKLESQRSTTLKLDKKKLTNQFVIQTQALYDNGQEMLKTVPRDAQYRDFVGATRRYDTALWTVVGKPGTAPAAALSNDDVAAVSLINAITSRSIYQFQIRTIGGRLTQVPEVNFGQTLQELAQLGSPQVQQLATEAITIVRLTASLPVTTIPVNHEAKYRNALIQIRGMVDTALAPDPVVDPANPPVVTPLVNPPVVTPPVTPPVVNPAPNPDGGGGAGGIPPARTPKGGVKPLPGNGGLDSPRG